MSTSTNPKNQISTLTSVPAPPGSVQVCAPRKPRPGFQRIVIGWRPVPLHADLVDDIAFGELSENAKWLDKFGVSYEEAMRWRPRKGPRCLKCFLKEAKPGHFCRWGIKSSPNASPKRVVYKPIFKWVPV